MPKSAIHASTPAPTTGREPGYRAKLLSVSIRGPQLTAAHLVEHAEGAVPPFVLYTTAMKVQRRWVWDKIQSGSVWIPKEGAQLPANAVDEIGRLIDAAPRHLQVKITPHVRAARDVITRQDAKELVAAWKKIVGK